jgi:dolichyl-phosphooligosaccharide-protein glycotransferase
MENEMAPHKRKMGMPQINLNGILKFLAAHWAIILVLFIVLIGVQVRLLDYRWPYLRNIDSYNFMRDMQMIVDNGGVFPGNEPLMLAPEGLYKGMGSFYPYLGAYSYIAFRAVSPATQLWQFLIGYPALLASLIAIPTYFLTKKLYDKKAGVIAALLILFDVSIVSRTLGGDPDNDGIVLLMPIIIITLFIYLQDYLSKNGHLGARGLLYSALLGVLLSIWAWTWGGWSFVIWIMAGYIAIFMAINELHKKDKKRAVLWLLFVPGLILDVGRAISEFLRTRSLRKASSKIPPLASGFVVTMVVLIIIMTLLVDGTFIFSLFSQLFGIANFGDIKSETGTFPNVYVSVAELQSIGGSNSLDTAKQIILHIGAPQFFAAILAMGYLAYSYLRNRKHLEALLLLFIWFMGPFIATFVAVRFLILFATPIAILAGILFSKVIKMVTEEDKTVAD